MNVKRSGRLRRAATIAVVLGAGLTGVVATATPAAAASNCQVGTYSARGSWASCASGGGSYQSWTQCEVAGSWYTVYGPSQAAGSGVLSISSCHWGSNRRSYGVITY
ncbi:hypothetical protein QEZ54_34545 [Catellatospora sp. KI3]|uniref:hypothetical protein n=1 Tax=Catellatospora sp. KI3 TaxID=3041620 RepID=UPI0024831F48|nr:hypothetical protein [Catellatospora sp. KI3]MDI1466107.1 hypothetical protein [Catellatospora sp. KI3]